MPIVNRDGDPSEKKEWINWVSSYGQSGLGVGTGSTYIIAGPIPYPYIVQSVMAVSSGASGAPQLVMSLNRNINSTGNTAVLIGISNYVIPGGASLAAVTGWSGLAVPGSTLLLGSAGDYITISTAVANTACTQLMINVVLKKVQDIVSHNGIST